MWIVLSLVSLVLTLAVGWWLPAAAAKRLLPTLAAGTSVTTNYRGLRVPTGLGIVWVVWAVGVAFMSNVVSFASRTYVLGAIGAGQSPQAWWMALGDTPFATSVTAVPVLLVLGAAVFGLIDDVLGSGEARGFGGHFAALREGTLTTGMVKLLGIGALAVVSGTGIASSIDRVDPMVAQATGWTQMGLTLAAWVVASLVIALAANFVNLTDLRPGRAMKAYLPLAIAGVGLSSWGAWMALQAKTAAAQTSGFPTGDAVWVWLAASVLCLAVLVLGPVFALWRYDLGERAMLGDAGANAMGALAGYLMARGAPLWLLVALALVLLALNLASERVSFTSVIERVGLLKWIDGLGRVATGTVVDGMEQGSDDGVRAGGPAPQGDDARRDDVS